MITHERLLEVMRYDPATGAFVWKVRAANCVRVNRPAGGIHPLGYRVISIEGKKYYAHRLAWFYVHGVWPPAEVDHVNEDRVDNRLSNLRLATHSENNRHRGKTKRNTSGYKGVALNKRYGLWVARIRNDSRDCFLGYFDSPEKAHEAYCAAAIKYHGEFAKT